MEITNFFSEIKTISTILHVGSAVVGMGAALMGDLLFNFYSADKKLNRTEIKTLDLLSTIVWFGLLALALSGIMLFLSDPARYMASEKFMAKLTILAVLVINGFFLSKKIWPRLIKAGFLTDKKERRTRRIAFACGTISVVSWVSVLVLGILDRAPLPYPYLIGIYVFILFCGINVALRIEKKQFGN